MVIEMYTEPSPSAISCRILTYHIWCLTMLHNYKLWCYDLYWTCRSWSSDLYTNLCKYHCNLVKKNITWILCNILWLEKHEYFHLTSTCIPLHIWPFSFACLLPLNLLKDKNITLSLCAEEKKQYLRNLCNFVIWVHQ